MVTTGQIIEKKKYNFRILESESKTWDQIV